MFSSYYLFFIIAELLWSSVVTASNLECSSGPDGAMPSDTVASGHKLKWTRAVISRPAPQWSATAVVPVAGGQGSSGKHTIKELKLTDFRGKYLVFFFYPLDFTFVCPTEILAFSDRIDEFRKIGAEVVGCSVDSHFTHLAWTQTVRSQGGLGTIRFPLLSDMTHSISRNYGVYLEDNGHTLRGLFIIDPKGIVRQITMNDLPVGRSVDETLRLVQAFQFTDKHGEVCPANWKPGADTIIPDPEGKIKYFQAHNADEGHDGSSGAGPTSTGSSPKQDGVQNKKKKIRNMFNNSNSSSNGANGKHQAVKSEDEDSDAVHEL